MEEVSTYFAHPDTEMFASIAQIQSRWMEMVFQHQFSSLAMDRWLDSDRIWLDPFNMWIWFDKRGLNKKLLIFIIVKDF